ncbi:MAG: acyl-CoA reductase [Verrucomicrobia bacterium]|jgi:hypothetical protein|nr:acyl-CoA reductase [Verrucomicrobiota bacterium]MBT7066318.1 acyl-CoA reductase [Verrucomicrobiota bacterium]
MQMNYKDIEFLNVTEAWSDERFRALATMPPFSDEVIAYLDALSRELNNHPRLRRFPDVASLAFYCRKANLLQLKDGYGKASEMSLGRGVVFHIAPSNVPVNFAYSLLVGLLSGNANIVRAPTKEFEQVSIIVDAIRSLSARGNHPLISERIIIVRYDRQSQATHYFSSLCDVRVIWGGDETIKRVRESVLPPRSFDIAFADRYSICVINADAFVHEDAPERIATGFYNDTYLSDQNACTSPHLVVWIGEEANVSKAQSVFWKALHRLVKERYRLPPVLAMDKLVGFCKQAIRLKDIERVKAEDNLIWRVHVADLPPDIDAFRCKAGYFSEYHAADIAALSKIINRKYQTLAYYGLSKQDLEAFFNQEKPCGIDRMVPIGSTMDFSLVWDGHDLIRMLSRACTVS